MTRPARTIGPLHPEDLEPHRFEDMVRQLLYDLSQHRPELNGANSSPRTTANLHLRAKLQPQLFGLPANVA
jgi:hypothetical protein